MYTHLSLCNKVLIPTILGSSLRNEKIEPINNYNYDKFPQHFGLKVRSRSEIPCLVRKVRSM